MMPRLAAILVTPAQSRARRDLPPWHRHNKVMSTTNTNLAVCTSSLTKEFDGTRAVNNLNLNVARGVFYGFLGPNGAGKSTTIKMLTGLLGPTAGSIEILGLDFASQPVEVKKQIG